jgi:hypothetical protein
VARTIATHINLKGKTKSNSWRLCPN